MLKFLRLVLAIITAQIVITFFSIVLVIAIVAAASSGDASEIAENSILHLQFDQPIADRATENPLAGLDFMSGSGPKESISLFDVRRALRKAADDDNIKGIFLDLNNVVVGGTMRSILLEDLVAFKKSGKFIYAYAENYDQASYQLATAADSIFMMPMGGLMWNGLASNPIFLQGMLEKLDIDVKLIRVGKYKSAGEPFIRKDLSADNRMQMESYMNSLYAEYLRQVSRYGGLPTDSLRRMADRLDIRSDRDALDKGMVHALWHRDQVLELLANKTKAKSIEKIKMADLGEYLGSLEEEEDETENEIAVVYANGEISGGEGDDENIGSERLSATIRKARLDDDIKAVVLRVNSPGGDALASEVIRRELVLLNKKKPLVVSMGNVAASGGYWIAADADSIFAEPTTITGSIGVFGLVPDFSGFFVNKTGITFDRVVTGPYADIMSGVRPMRADEEAIIQTSVNRIYDDFILLVATGRRLSADSVQAMAQGRVYTGRQALALGLVDRLGTEEDALACASGMAKVKEYKIRRMPTPKDPFEEILNQWSDDAAKTKIEENLGVLYAPVQTASKALRSQGILARMEYVPTY
jgi:protease-4